MISKIPLTSGVVVIVDQEDFDKISIYKWQWNKKRNSIFRRDYLAKKTLYIHRVIMGCPQGMVVDHINGNFLDNRKTNLRICTHSQNLKNQKKPKNNTSGYKGVVYDGRNGGLKKRWIAQLKVNGKHIKLGYFETPELAAKAYDLCAKKEFGQYANLNFKDQK